MNRKGRLSNNFPQTKLEGEGETSYHDQFRLCLRVLSNGLKDQFELMHPNQISTFCYAYKNIYR